MNTSHFRVAGKWLLIALALGTLVINLLAAGQAHRMLRFEEDGARTAPPEQLSRWERVRVLLTGVRMPRPRAALTPADLGLPYEEYWMTGDDGRRLSAWHIPQADAAGLVLLFHGYGGEKSSLLEEARQFGRLGFASVVVDFQGSGASSGTGTTLGFREAEDVVLAVNWVRTHLHPRTLILYGQSMGAAALLRAMAYEGVRADGVIVESVFDTLLQTVRNRFVAMKLPSSPGAELLVWWGGWWTGYPAFSLRPVDDIARVKAGVLVMHGALDPRVRTTEALRVYQAAPEPKAWREFEGAGHESLAAHSPEAWRAAVSGHLDAVIGRVRASP